MKRYPTLQTKHKKHLMMKKRTWILKVMESCKEFHRTSELYALEGKNLLEIIQKGETQWNKSMKNIETKETKHKVCQ